MIQDSRKACPKGIVEALLGRESCGIRVLKESLIVVSESNKESSSSNITLQLGEETQVADTIELTIAEMSKWCQLRMVKTEVLDLNPEELASYLAAHLAKYNKRMMNRFQKLREALEKEFNNELVDGDMFHEMDEDQKRDFVESVMAGITQDESERAVRKLRRRVDDYISKLVEGTSP